MSRRYTPNDTQIVRTIKDAFQLADREILREAERAVRTGVNMAHSIALMAPALSGSCALMALFDPTNSVLRVANTGDSRAVLGRWDVAEGKYVATSMSIDQTGFNQDEVDRLRREHPDEEVSQMRFAVFSIPDWDFPCCRHGCIDTSAAMASVEHKLTLRSR